MEHELNTCTCLCCPRTSHEVCQLFGKIIPFVLPSHYYWSKGMFILLLTMHQVATA